jgi:hypothetical protein
MCERFASKSNLSGGLTSLLEVKDYISLNDLPSAEGLCGQLNVTYLGWQYGNKPDILRRIKI